MNGDFSQKLNQVLSDPAMMAQIKALADTMTEAGGQTEKSKMQEQSPEPEKGEEVFGSFAEQMTVPSFFTPSASFEKNMRNACALLNALKPFLDERRCAKIDKMLSMMHFAQMAGQLGNFF